MKLNKSTLRTCLAIGYWLLAGGVGCGQRDLTSKLLRRLLLAGFLTNNHLSRVSLQPRLSNENGANEVGLWAVQRPDIFFASD